MVKSNESVACSIIKNLRLLVGMLRQNLKKLRGVLEKKFSVEPGFHPFIEGEAAWSSA
jgi:hypothetical protein